ncbi:hypothetical protein DIPPA_06447 [Diplonema papillatum]|nr:hypothetical protein DIPPA_06447 [Diplonema papillatum]
MHRCRRLLRDVERLATDIIDEHARRAADPYAADKVRTQLVDSLKVAEDAKDWEREWQREEAEDNATRVQSAERLQAWQDGSLPAGSRETFREREERLYTSGQMESNKVPPHPPAFDNIVRKVRYAHLMPIPEAPTSNAESLYLSKAFPVLTTLTDRLLEIEGVTLEQLALLPIEKHDELIANNYTVSLLPETSLTPGALSDLAERNALEASSAEQTATEETAAEAERFQGRSQQKEDVTGSEATQPVASAGDGVQGQAQGPAPAPEPSSGVSKDAAEEAKPRRKTKKAKQESSPAAAAPSSTEVDAVGDDDAAAGLRPQGDRSPSPSDSPDEVFKGQKDLMQSAENVSVSTDADVKSRGEVVVRAPVRKREQALTASQTIAAVALLCEAAEDEAWSTILEAVGTTKELRYVAYYWNLAKKEAPDLLKRRDDTRLYDAYVKALGLCGDVNTAYNTIEGMKSHGVTPTVDTWNNLMVVYNKNNDPESALKVAQNMRMYARVEPNHQTFLHTLEAHRDDPTVDVDANARRALNVMYEMTQVYRLEPTRQHYEILLQVLQHVSNASDWYLELQTQAQQMKHLGIPWSIPVYNVLLWVEACRGDVAKVRELFLTYRKRKLPPIDRTYSSVIQAYACSVPTDNVLTPGIYMWARNEREEWERSHDAPPPFAEWRERMFNEGMAIYEVTKSHDGPLYRTVYALLYMAGKLKPERLRDLWETEAKPLLKGYPRLYTTYILGLLELANKGDPEALDDAEETFVEATKTGLRLPRKVYQQVMEAHIKTGREGSVDVALDYMRAMENSGQAMTSAGVLRLKRLIDEMGPKRDAIRRAKRLMQRRNELSNSLFTDAEDARPVLNYPGEQVNLPGLTPDGFAFPSSETGVNADGTLAGESFEDRKAALAQMGYQPMNVENTEQLRSNDKVGQWLKYTASNPHLNFSPEHPSFDKVLQSRQKLGVQGKAVNPWHQERMAAQPEVYKKDGTVARDPDFMATESDSPAGTLLAMEASQKPEELFDTAKPYYDKKFAHKAQHPAAWTGDQEAFMSSWLSTNAGKSYMQQSARARQLRATVARRKEARKATNPYPDEEPFATRPPDAADDDDGGEPE